MEPIQFSSVLIFLAAICSKLEIASAIRCWECNSEYDVRCLDPFSEHTVALVDCDQRQEDVEGHLEPAEGQDAVGKAKYCRKTSQYVEGEYRVVRGCGWLDNQASLADRSCFARSGTKEVQIEHCVCDTDMCNSGRRLIGQGLMAAMMALTVVFATLLRSAATNMK